MDSPLRARSAAGSNRGLSGECSRKIPDSRCQKPPPRGPRGGAEASFQIPNPKSQICRGHPNARLQISKPKSGSARAPESTKHAPRRDADDFPIRALSRILLDEDRCHFQRTRSRRARMATDAEFWQSTSQLAVQLPSATFPSTARKLLEHF